MRCGIRVIKTEVIYVHDFVGDFDSLASRRITYLAIQPILGVLPKRRTGTDCGRRDRFASRRSLVTTATFQAKFDLKL